MINEFKQVRLPKDSPTLHIINILFEFSIHHYAFGHVSNLYNINARTVDGYCTDVARNVSTDQCVHCIVNTDYKNGLERFSRIINT